MEFALVSVALSGRDDVHLKRAGQCIDAAQDVISLRAVASESLANDQAVSWPIDLSFLEDHGPNVIAVTSLPFEDNWFSHSTRGVSIISTAGWSDQFSPPGLASFLMMEIALSVYAQVSDVGEDSLKPHDKSIGCLLDWCVDKQEISWKLRCGSLCAEHEGLFKQHGASNRQLKAVQRILEACRLTAFGRLAFDDLPRTQKRYRVFIGSSGETKTVAYALQQCLESAKPDIECTVWTDGVFKPSSDFMSALLTKTRDVDYAILIAGRDDIATWRGEDVNIPRDNVTFELGLFIGALGKDRTFLVCPENAPKLPTDLSGMVHVRYRDDRLDDNLEAALRSAATSIANAIKETGRRDRWNAYIER